MHPILFSIGVLPIYSYGICMGLGFITLYGLVFAEARRAGNDWDHILSTSLGVLLGSILGARLTQAFVEPDKTTRLLDFYSLVQPGAPGNVLGLMVGGYLGGVLVRGRLTLPSLGNYFAPAMAAASVVWRIGCTLGGCCYGIETNLPWAIYLDGAFRHPTMIYDGLFNVLMFGILWGLRGKFKRDNELLHLYMVCYSLFRFPLEYLRVYPKLALGLTGIQWLCAAILLWEAIRYWQTNRRVELNALKGHA